MANESNQLTLEWVKQENGVLKIPGFCSEFSAKEWEEMESRFFGPEATELEKALKTKQNLFFEKQSGAIILRPNLEPIDMDGAVAKDIWGEVEGYKGSWYECYGGSWTLLPVKGNPAVKVEYQGVVEVAGKKEEGEEGEEMVEADGTAAKWWIQAGERLGMHRQGTGFLENEGVVVWTAGNMLVKNEENRFTVHLVNYGPDKKPNNGIFVSIVSGKEVQMCHYTNISTNATYPPKDEVLNQWEKFSLPTAKEIYEWPSKPTVFALFVVQDSIVLAVNGMQHNIVMKAKQFDVGSDSARNDYPVLLREGATLFIEGRGQGSIGFKKMVYDAEGVVESPLLFPGYELNNPRGMSRAVLHPGTRVSTRGWHGGSIKMGGDVQTGPLGSEDENKGCYMECRLSGMPVNSTGKNEYYKRVTEHTPALLRFRLLDERVRETLDGALPQDIEPGDINSYTENYSIDDNMEYSGSSLEVNFAVVNKDYATLQEIKTAVAKISVTPKGGTTPEYKNSFFISTPKFLLPQFGEINVRLAGRDIVELLKQQEIGIPISFDDFEWTDVQLLSKLCEMAGVTLLASGTPVKLPKSTDAKNPIFYYQPQEKMWTIMNKVRRNGKLLYPNADMALIYKDLPTAISPADFTLGRGEGWPVEGIEYSRQANFRTRIYVTGQARNSGEGFRAGDKLVGAIIHRTMETETNMTVVEEIMDTELADWPAIDARAREADKQFNTLEDILNLKITDARGYLGVLPFMVFSWTDPLYPLRNGKYIIKGLSFDGDPFNLDATVEGKRLN